MTRSEVERLNGKLINIYTNGFYISKASLFRMGLDDGIITEDEFWGAREYYGSLWNYVGD